MRSANAACCAVIAARSSSPAPPLRYSTSPARCTAGGGAPPGGDWARAVPWVTSARARPKAIHLMASPLFLLGSDHAAVDLPDHHGRAAWPAARPEIGPVAEAARIGRVAPLARRLAGMLDVDEHRPAVRRPGRAGDLAVDRAHQEAPHLAAGEIAGEHLVVADARHLALVHHRRAHVGLHPERAAGVERDAVGAGE